MEVLKVAVLAAVLCAVHGQAVLPRCSALRRDLFQQSGAVFRSVGVQAIGVCDNLCVNRNGRVRRFYACCPGNTLVFVSGGRPTTSRPLDALNGLIICQLPRATTPPPTTPPPPPPTLPSCPSGPTRINQYLQQHQDRLCEFRCSFRVATQGISLGSRSRTVYRCCNGEPELRTGLSLGLYGCPEDNDTQSTPSPSVQSTSSPNVESTSSTSTPNVESTSSTSIPNVESTSSTSTPNVESTSSTSSPSVQSTTAPSTTARTSPPRATTSPTAAASSCPSGPTRLNQYIHQHRDRLCERTCSFRVGTQGISLGSRSRTIWRCCTGEPKVVSRALGLYSCP